MTEGKGKGEGKTLLVTGSRSIRDAALVSRTLDALPFKTSLLVHGGAVGVDTLAGKWAAAKGIPIIVVRPDFKKWPIAKYRWKAYTIRDREMVDMVQTVVAIWDGKSSGTQLTFQYAEDKNKLYHIERVKK